MKNYALFPLLGFITIILTNCKDKETADPAVPAPKIESYFDAAYVASTGFEDLNKSAAISDGKPARVIKDLIGDKDLLWSKDKGVPGAEVPSPMWSTPPVYTKDELGGFITVQNVAPNLWLSSDFAAIPQPYDVYVVLRDLQGVRYEGYYQVGYGLRNQGDKLEFKMEEATGGKKTQVNMTSGNVLEYNKMSIVRMRVDGANSKLWINNVAIPPGAVDLGKGQIVRLGYGTNSHAAYHDFFGMWVKFGTLSEADHKDIYDKLTVAYNPGTLPTKPIATNVRLQWNNAGGWTAKYTYYSPTSTPEDVSKTEYQWGYHNLNKSRGDTDLNETKLIKGATKATLLRSDFPNEIPSPHDGSQTEIFVMVKVYDTNGATWSRLLRSEFLLDNNN